MQHDHYIARTIHLLLTRSSTMPLFLPLLPYVSRSHPLPPSQLTTKLSLQQRPKDAVKMPMEMPNVEGIYSLCLQHRYARRQMAFCVQGLGTAASPIRYAARMRRVHRLVMHRDSDNNLLVRTLVPHLVMRFVQDIISAVVSLLRVSEITRKLMCG